MGDILDIIEQAHDKLFKETFGNVEIAKDFMSEYLPTTIQDIIDLNTLEPRKRFTYKSRITRSVFRFIISGRYK